MTDMDKKLVLYTIIITMFFGFANGEQQNLVTKNKPNNENLTYRN